jgi:hypothetical protein
MLSTRVRPVENWLVVITEERSTSTLTGGISAFRGDKITLEVRTSIIKKRIMTLFFKNLTEVFA